MRMLIQISITLITNMNQAQSDLLKTIQHDMGVDFVEFALSRVENINFGEGKTNPLLCACHQIVLNPDVITLLVKGGADVNVKWYGSTPLLFLAKKGALELVKLVLEHGADPHVANNQGFDVMHHARDSCVPEMIEFARELVSNKKEVMLQKENDELRARVEKLEKAMAALGDLKDVLCTGEEPNVDCGCSEDA